MEDVLINFVGNVQELKPAENAMDSIIQKDKALGEQAVKTSAAMSDWGKKTTEAGKQANSSIEKLITTTKNLDKSIVGGSYKKVLQDLQKEFDLTGKQAKKFLDNLKKDAKLQLLDSNLAAEDRAHLEGLVVAADDLLQTVTPLRQRLKETKEELNAMAEAGKAGTPEFEALKQKAGELDDQMRDLNATVKNVGSDTKNIDGLISLASGVAGGFAVVQGTMALFSSENEEVQQALLKVNAAMAILQGLQQVQNVLQKESAASLLFTRTARVADTVATEAGTAAQVKLNTAMKANPIGLVIAGITALITVLSIFGDDEEDTVEKTKRLEAATRSLNDAFIKLGQIDDIKLNKPVELLQKQLDLLKAQGVSQNVILAKEQEINKARFDNNKVNLFIKSLGSEAKALTEINGIQDESRKKIDAVAALMSKLRDTGKEYIEVFENGNTVKKNLENLNSELEAEFAEYNKLNDAVTEYYDNQSALAQKQAEIAKFNYEQQSKSTLAFIEKDIAVKKAAIIKNQIDSIESINAVTDAEIKAINQRAKVATDKRLNPNITAGEIAKIEAEAKVEILSIKRDQAAELLEIQKDSIQAQLNVAKAGTEEEYTLQIKLIEALQDLELKEAKVTQDKADEINNRFAKQKEELLRKFNIIQLENQISFYNADIERFGVSESQKLTLIFKRLDAQKQIEILQAEENAAKIAEINIKYDNLTREARIASINAVLNSNLKTLDVFGGISKARNETIVNSDRFSYEQRIAANNQLLESDNTRFTLEKGALDKQLAQKLISNEEYNLRLQELLNQQAANQLQHDEKDLQLFQANLLKKTDSLKSVFALLQAGVNDIFGNDVFAQAINAISNIGLEINKLSQDWDKLTSTEKKEAMKGLASEGIVAAQQIIAQSFAQSGAARQADLDNRLKALNEQKEKELAAENLTAQNKADIQQKYAEREKLAKRNAWLADKEAKKQQAIINGLLAVTLAFATIPFPASLLSAGIVAAGVLAEVVAINRVQPPKFKGGKRRGTYEGFGYVDDGGKIEPIVRADGSVEMASGKAKQRLTYLAKDDTVYPSIAHFLKEFVYPQVPDHVQQAAPGQPFDYEKMAAKIAGEMAGIIPAPAQVTNIISKDGFKSFVKKGNDITEFKNERYSMS